MTIPTGWVTLPDDDDATRHVFVFGSNTRGVHGAGAAKTARLTYGAVLGVGEGLTGRTYALPTVGDDMRPLSLPAVRDAVARFVAFARSRPDLTFHVTPVGCGIAGFAPAQVAPLFAGSPHNVILPPSFLGFVP